ncbi:MAG TPA: hypothetical protein VF189_06555 [Patescibacteria group bacterium]
MTLPKDSGETVYLDRGGAGAFLRDFADEFIHLDSDSDSRENARTFKWIAATIGALTFGGSDVLNTSSDSTGLFIAGGILGVSALLGVIHRTYNGLTVAANKSIDRVEAREAALRRGDRIYYN